ncbi:MAG: hypothetical protein BWY85_02252 [Firmicutes bacterium ADurb.Bin506]|nr:MAG: hypothetical protein BWY85_02252 [Firmicutes bacterium ADurb.Bin506]
MAPAAKPINGASSCVATLLPSTDARASTPAGTTIPTATRAPVPAGLVLRRLLSTPVKTAARVIPMRAPAITSVGECTVAYTRVKPTTTVRITAAVNAHFALVRMAR